MSPTTMILLEPLIAARRRQAARSVRPRSRDGDDSPRAEQLVLDLCAAVVLPEDAALVQSRSRDLFKALRPQNPYHCWIVSQVGLLSIRIDRCERVERRSRDKAAIKAEVLWESDRRIEAIRLGGQLANQPEEVLELLRRTPQGCEWLMGRWALLAYSADVQRGTWTAPQVDLAFDLLGTPALFRAGRRPGVELDSEGRVVAGSDDPAGVARRQIAALKARRDEVEGLDRAARSLAEADLGDDSADPELKRLRRHEAVLHSRLRWCLGQLRDQSPEKEPYRGLWASWVGGHEAAPEVAPAVPSPTPAPAPAPAPPPRVGPKAEAHETPGGRFPMVHPPFCLEPDEAPAPGELADIPMILADRHRRQLLEAEAGRDARRREVEKLRA